MTKRNYLLKAATEVATPPQSEPLNERQIPNSAGGFAFPVNVWTRLDRFLILGSEGGSYYATEKQLTKENIKAVAKAVKQDGVRVVKRIVEISESGRAPKNDPALLALAYASAKGDEATRRAAFEALPRVARIGTHLFHFVAFAHEFRGWGRGLRRAIGNWYTSQTPDELAYQVVKYQQRDGWSHRDLLRLSHPFSEDHQSIFHFAVKGELEGILTPSIIVGHAKLQLTESAEEAAEVIRQYNLPRESVPTQFLTDRVVWEALLEKMPMTAMIRNLGNMSKCGLLSTMSPAEKLVVSRLTDQNAIKKARVHPIQLLMALKTYEAGHGVRGKGEWRVSRKTVDALDEAYYLAFSNLTPTGKRFYLGMDISGSMWSGEVAGCVGLTPAEASGAMAMVTAKTEENYYAAGFTCADRIGRGLYGGRWDSGRTEMTPLSLSPRQRLDDVLKVMNKLQAKMGGTDCALPMLDALNQKIAIDTFIVYTDNETWAGDIHPTQALEKYRQKMGIPAKLVVVGMVSNNFTIADPKDNGMLDVIGFDTATPQVIADFAKE